ncbi:lysylphosphatidylglycerol synthase transmembrane domain-containing protein [Scrofimicrobium sp. R131]|uniref:Lysylphosphatidylglycerol synthase transmembrane domain-containing protein n=1 Tax=Scrofimicrobium appendicitidis TaxID=3079930 RepID=A0AAU7V7A3_9ACTO
MDELLVRKRLPEPVVVADRLPVRQRRPEDLYEAGANLLGIALVLLLGVYAHSTTLGVTEDVRVAFGSVIRQLLLVPVSVIQGLFVILAPTAVIFALARRGRIRSILAVLVTGAVTAILGWLISMLIPHLPVPLVDSLLVNTPSGAVTSVDVVIMVLVAALTVAGDGSRVKSIRYSWYGIWFLLVVGVIRGTTTVAAVLVTVLLGRMIGCLARWILGFSDRRATPTDLVEALLTVGITPKTVIRADLDQELDSWRITESDRQPDFASGLVNPELEREHLAGLCRLKQAEPHRSSFADRHYQVVTADGRHLDLHVLDPSRAITGTIGDLWDNFRLRGLSRWISPTLKANAERAVLTTHVAVEAGAHTPPPVGIAEAGDSVVVVWEQLPPVSTLLALRHHEVPLGDEVLTQAWEQLLSAHSRGVSHRNLDVDSLVLDADQQLWILHWDQGEVATGELNRHIDRAQMLAHLALVAGPERALASARRYFSVSELLAISLVLQGAVLPPGVRGQLRRTKVLEELRSNLAELTEATPQVTTPLRLQRFSLRTVLMAILALAVLVAVVGGLNFNAIMNAAQDANAWWMLAAFLIGSTTWLAAAMPLVAFAPKKISLWQATLAQMGGSLANIVAPAGVGPAAFNLRFLNKQGVAMPLAVATVTLVQISQFLTSVVLLLGIVVITGTSLDIPIPTMTIVWVLAAILALVATLLAIPMIRNWIWAKVKPTWEQVYPQLLWIMGHPKELGFAMAGNLLGNLGFIGAFAASLAAFGYYLSPMTVTITFLVSTTLGSIIPSPGGIGPVEAALTGGLQVAGIPGAVAISAAVIYRLVTFYGRIPFGWLAMRYLQRRDLI